MTAYRLINVLLWVGWAAANAVAWNQDTMWTWAPLSGLAYALTVKLGERRGYARRSIEVNEAIERAAKWRPKP